MWQEKIADNNGVEMYNYPDKAGKHCSQHYDREGYRKPLQGWEKINVFII